jgi:hypothetical protein
MKRDTLFQSQQQMPDPNRPEDVVRTAQSFQELRINNWLPANLPIGINDVENVVRKRRGYTTY